MRSFFRETSGFFPEGTFQEVALPDYFPRQSTMEDAVGQVVVSHSDILNSREGEKELARQHAKELKLRRQLDRAKDENRRKYCYENLFAGLDDMPSRERAKAIREVNKLAPEGSYLNMDDDELEAANANIKKNWK